jgi:membrane protease YdiL (CAAX protease family)
MEKNMTATGEPRPQKQRDFIVVSAALVLPTIITLAYFVLLREHAARVQQCAYLVGKTLQFALPITWMLVFYRNELMFPRQDSRAWMVFGLSFGMMVAAAAFAIFFAWLEGSEIDRILTSRVAEKVQNLGVGTHVRFILLGVFYALCHSLLEEYYWRWFVFRLLDKHLKLSIAIVISSLGFMAHHVLLLATFLGWDQPLSYVFSAGIAVGGGVWAWIYHHTRSLMIPWLSHLLVDAGIFGLGYLLIRDLL